MPKFQRQDTSIYYELSGQGAPIVWIQGVGVIGNCWEPQVAALPKYSSLVFDNRGIGKSIPYASPISIESMAEDTAALLNEVGWSKAHVVGHSMGGLIAQELALRYPDRVRSLSLLCTFSEGSEAARITPWVLWMSMRTYIGTPSMRRRAFLEMIFSDDYLRQNNAVELAARLEPLMGRDLAKPQALQMKQLMAMSRYNRAKELVKIQSIPTLVLSAENDLIAKPTYGKRLAAAIPGAVYHEIPNASHAVTIERASEVNTMLKRFLEQVS